MKTVISYLYPPLCIIYTFGILFGCAYLIDNTSFLRAFFSFFDDLYIGGIWGLVLAIPLFMGAVFLSTVPSALTVDLLLYITGNKNEATFTSEVLWFLKEKENTADKEIEPIEATKNNFKPPEPEKKTTEIQQEEAKPFEKNKPIDQVKETNFKQAEVNISKFNTLIKAPSNVRTLGGLELSYRFDEGQQISEGHLILELKGSSSHIGLYASKNCIIRFKQEDDGSIIRLEGKHLCTMNTPIELVWKDIDKEHEISMGTKSNEHKLSLQDNSSRSETVEVQLEELKKLYGKKLISKSVYEQKQKEILKNI